MIKNLRKHLLLMLSLVLIGLINSNSLIAQVVNVGSGSYTLTFPGTDAAGRNGFPSGVPALSGVAATKPVPTNDWWSDLMKNDHGGQAFNYPLSFVSQTSGLVVNYTVPNHSPIEYRQPIGDVRAIVVGTEGLNATKSTPSNHSDWGVTMDWNNQFNATMLIGSPFVYFQKNTTAAAKVTVNFNPGGVSIQGNKLVVTGNMNGSNYVVYAPAGSTWSGSGGIYTSTLNGKNYWSMVMLPPGANVTTSITQFEQYAYVFPSNTAVAWNYNASTSKLRTTFTVTADVKEGSNNQVLQGLLPHQWSRLASGTASGPTYSSVRGQIKTMAANSFIVENTFSGILPTIPNLGKYSGGFNPGALASKVAQMKNDGLAEWTDSYNQGQDMNRLVQAARIADQTGDIASRDALINTVQARLEDWFTAEGGEVAFLFYYNADWDALIGYPAGHRQDTNLNDHHFHWGYFIHAAAAIEQYKPGWATQWGGMIDLLIRDAANPSRTDAMFPFLRNFSPYAGHSWANGFASEPFGNDQESTSESMQFNSALIHWGTLTGNNAIRDLGIYLYTTEESTVQEYWFDTEERNFQPEYQNNMVARVWGGGYDNGTWWTTDIAASYGIQMYPIHGGSLYLGHHKPYLQRVWTEITQNTQVLNNVPNDNLWYDTYWQFLSFLNPQQAVNLYNSYTNRSIKVGSSDAQTYHWLHGMNAMGQVKNEVTANYPIAACFEQNGVKTYVAHNYGSSAITVNFSDGFNLSVPAKKMATNRDIAVGVTITLDKTEIPNGGNVNITATVTGTVSKVEFYAGATLLGTDTSSPFTLNSGALTAGFPNLYAKAYSGTNFNVSNIIAVQVGAQLGYSGTPNPVPGVIESGKYDKFEGGNGQGIAYSDNTSYNEGDFRPTEGVDASNTTGEGATVGWIEAGEWLEYTVNASQAGAYKVTMRYASGSTTGGGPFWFERNGSKISSDVNVTFTGTDWNVWSNVIAPSVNLVAGQQVIRLAVGNGGFNLGKLTFELVGTGNPVLTTIVVTPSNSTVNQGSTQQFTATGKDQYGANFAFTPSWSVNGGSINSSGLYKASSLGTFAVNVTSGSITGTTNVTVVNNTPVLTSISLTPTGTNVVVNGTKQFTAQALDQFGVLIAGTINWTATCGSVNSSGLYTAPSSLGNCQVTATSGSKSAVASVQVTAQGGSIGDVLWEENFNTFNTSIWSPLTGDGCAIGLCGWGNQELEYYSPNNVYVENIAGETGNKALVLEAKRETVGSSSFTSGKVDTDGKVAIQYGLIEVRMKVPNLQKGLWPAAWLLGDANLAWPAKGEIDMMEMGHTATERARQGFPSTSENYYVGANAIWAAPDGSVASTAWDVDYDQPYIAAQPLNDRFVTYRLYWEPTQMRFTVIDNGVERDLYTNALPIGADGDLKAFNRPFYMLLNLAVGGNFTDAASPGAVTAPTPAKMYVDYVRVSQYNGHGSVEFKDGTITAETGVFGVFTDNTTVNTKLNIGVDAEIFAWGGTVKQGTEAPAEGTKVIAWETTTANSWFGGGVVSLYGKNMSNYATNGKLKFKIKIPANVTFRIGITDNYTNEKYVSFPAGQTKYGLVRNGNWGQVEIPLVDLGGIVAFQDMNYMFAIVSQDGALPTSTFQFAIDDIIWDDGNVNSPVLTSITVSPLNSAINQGQTKQFTAQGFDQNGNTMTANVNWSATGGSINTSGLYTGSQSGNFTVTATSGSISKSTGITVNVVNNGTDITDLGGTISVQYTDSPAGEGFANLIDNNVNTKYLTIHASGWVQYQAPASYVVTSYSIASANDAPERDPLSWTLQGSNNGTTWTNMDSRTGEDFATRFLTRSFTISNTIAYTYYRLNLNNNSGTMLQLAEIQLFGTLSTVAVTGVSLSPASVALTVGQTQQLTATVTPANATNKNVTWSSSNTSVASVSSSGLVTANAAGSATISVTTVSGGFVATRVVTVTAVPVLTSITVTPTTATINVGQTQQYAAQGLDQFGNAIAATFTWSTTGGSINASGLYSGSTAGNFTVTAQSGSVSKIANITVNVVNNDIDITDLGGGTISAQYTDSPAAEVIGKLIDNNVNTKYLTFHASGWVQYQAPGSYVVKSYTMTSANDAPERDPLSWTLQGSNNGTTWTNMDSRTGEDFATRLLTRTFTITNTVAYTHYRLNLNNNSGTLLQLAEIQLFGTASTNVAVTGVSIAPSTVSLTAGQTQQLTATVTPANATNKNVTWSTSNASIASVNASGLVTANAAGSATISVTTVSGGFVAARIVNVAAVPVLSSITVTPITATINTGQTQQFSAQGLDQFGNAIAASFAWSANGGTINGSGLYSGTTAGNFVVTATSGSVNKTANITVNAVASGWALPGRVESENFKAGGEGIGYHDLTAGNTGGAFRTSENVDIEATTDATGLYNIGWIDAGEWLAFDVNASASSNLYNLTFRVASPDGVGRFHVEIDGASVTGQLVTPATGGWQAWATVIASNVSINQGAHVMRVVFDAAGFNLNYMDATAATPVPVLTSIVVSPTSSTISQGQTKQFTAQGLDQFGAAFAISPTWSTTGGSVNSSGLYSGSAVGTFTVSATQSGKTGTASITVNAVATGCTIPSATGDFTAQVSNASSNPTITFVPSRTGVGSNIVLLYYATSVNGPWPGNIVTPGQAFQLTASSGQTIYYYYTYSIPEGGENNTSANKNHFVVGTCSNNARFGASDDLTDEVSIQLFPNPADNVLNIQSTGLEVSSYAIFNLTGQLMETKVNFDSVSELKIDVSELNAGHYLLQISNSKQTEMLRFIKR